jgi:hypothetical protein
VPVRILVAFFAKLKVYRFWGGEGLFAELLRILEKVGATGRARCVSVERAVIVAPSGWKVSCWVVGHGVAGASLRGG